MAWRGALANKILLAWPWIEQTLNKLDITQTHQLQWPDILDKHQCFCIFVMCNAIKLYYLRIYCILYYYILVNIS